MLRNCQLVGYLLFECIRIPITSSNVFEGLEHIPSKLVRDVSVRRCHEFATLHISKLTEPVKVHRLPMLLGTVVLGSAILATIAIWWYTLSNVGIFSSLMFVLYASVCGLFAQGAVKVHLQRTRRIKEDDIFEFIYSVVYLGMSDIALRR